MTVTLHGIPNCDTVKKAKKWLDSNGISYTFVNFKTTPPSEAMIQQWLDAVGVDVLVNKRGTTWRRLSEEEQATPATQLLATHTSIIKRPVLEHDGTLYVGFNDATYADIFGV